METESRLQVSYMANESMATENNTNVTEKMVSDVQPGIMCKKRVCTVRIVYRFSENDTTSVTTQLRAVLKKVEKRETEELYALDEETSLSDAVKKGPICLEAHQSEETDQAPSDAKETTKESHRTETPVTSRDVNLASQGRSKITEASQNDKGALKAPINDEESSKQIFQSDVVTITTLIKLPVKQKPVKLPITKPVPENPTQPPVVPEPPDNLPKRTSPPPTPTIPIRTPPPQQRTPTPPAKTPDPQPVTPTSMPAVETPDSENVSVKRRYHVKRIGGGYTAMNGVEEDFFPHRISKFELSRYSDATTTERLRTNQRWSSIYLQLMRHLKIKSDPTSVAEELVKEFERHVKEVECPTCKSIQEIINERKGNYFPVKYKDQTTFWSYTHGLGAYAHRVEDEADTRQTNGQTQFKQHE